MIQHTPVDTFIVDGIKVFVKREDLFGAFPYPPLGKLRGLRKLLDKYYNEGSRLVGCWDTRVSKLGQGLAVMSRDYPGMQAIVAYPVKKKEPVPNAVEISKQFGAEIFEMRGNHVGICYAQTTAYVKGKGGTMLPFGLECIESVQEIAEECKELNPIYFEGGTIILCCGSGVTLAGILAGLRHLPGKIIGISSGRSVLKIRQCVERYAGAIPEYVEIKEAELAYDKVPKLECPFPAHPNYDLKAWKFLCEKVETLKQPILFWNIGA